MAAHHNNLTLADYETLYEDSRLRYNKLQDEIQKDYSSKYENDIHPNTKGQQQQERQWMAARLMLARAYRVGVLQDAAARFQTPDLYGFLEFTQRETDEESGSLEHCHFLERLLMKKDDNNHNNNDDDVLQSVTVDVDAFFEEYPECARAIGKDQGDDHSENNDDDDDNEVVIVTDTTTATPAAPHKTRKLQHRTNEKQDDLIEVTTTVPPKTMTASSSSHSEQPPPLSTSNPYQNKPSPPMMMQNPSMHHPTLTQPQQKQQPVLTCPHSHGLPSNYSSTQQQQQSQRQSHQPLLPPGPSNVSGPSWDEYVAHNPFQTAREYASTAAATSKSSNHSYHSSQTRSQQQLYEYNLDPAPYQNPPPQPPPLYNPYHTLPPPSRPPSPPPPEPPAIRDSLRRKFQPPKRGAAHQPGSSQSAVRDARGVGGGGVSAPRPASRGGYVQQPAPNRSSNSGDDKEEDELPEELKRFGKELVQKIQDEIMDNGEPITFNDIAGLEDAKQTVLEVVCWPMKRPDLFTGLRRAPNGLLLYGPPGTGKTLVGKAIAHESGATFFSISSSSLTSKWIGEGEKLVRTLFAVASYHEPAVVFIDEIDSLLTQRKSDENEASRRIKTEFLVQLDGTGTSGQGRVLVIGATNRPQELDEAARRRFVKRLYIPLPKESDRETLLRVLLQTNRHSLVDADICKLAVETAGFSGADIKALSTDAAMGPIRDLGAHALEVDSNEIPPISFKHFRQALRGMKPSVAPSDLVQYEEWDNMYGSRRAQSCGDEDDADASGTCNTRQNECTDAGR